MQKQEQLPFRRKIPNLKHYLQSKDYFKQAQLQRKKFTLDSWRHISNRDLTTTQILLTSSNTKTTLSYPNDIEQ